MRLLACSLIRLFACSFFQLAGWLVRLLACSLASRNGKEGRGNREVKREKIEKRAEKREKLKFRIVLLVILNVIVLLICVVMITGMNLKLKNYQKYKIKNSINILMKDIRVGG